MAATLAASMSRARKRQKIKMSRPRIQTRLCPHCANSIAPDASFCPYCKADLLQSPEPEWPRYGEDFSDPPERSQEKARLTVKSKAILVLGLVVFALGVYLVGGNVERHDLGPLLAEQKARVAEQQSLLNEKDQRIKDLESQLARLRQDNQGVTGQIAALKAQLEERQSDLAAAQRKLAAAAREIERLSATRVAAAQRGNGGKSASGAAPAPPARLSRGLEPLTYETVRSTAVYEQPTDAARVVAQISQGTEITVIGSGGGWLEIRSRHGKPPGYVRADDAMFLSRAN